MSVKANFNMYVLGNQVTQGTLGNGGERQCQTIRILASMFWVTR